MKIDHEVALDAIEMTGRIIDAHGSRIAGSEACLCTAEDLKKEYQKWCDRVFEINFDQFPGAFFCVPGVFAACYIAGGLFWVAPHLTYCATAVLVLGLSYLTSQFIFMGSAFDRLFKKHSGKNVCGVIEPKKRPMQQILLSAHHDSAPICNFLRNHQKVYAYRVYLPVFFYGYFFLYSMSGYFPAFGFGANDLLHRISGMMFVIGLLFITPMFWFFNAKGALGASDNLISCIIGIKVVETVRKLSGRLDNTRIIVLSNDGEEIGLKGARAFVRESRGLIDECKTYVVNLDSICRYEDLTFLQSDLNGAVRLSARLADEGVAVASRLGYAVKKRKFPFGGGGTDAAPFAQAGVETTSIIGISTDFIRDGLVYHTANDTAKNLDPNAVEAAINIALNFILDNDALSHATE